MRIAFLLFACCISFAALAQEHNSEVLSHISYRYVSKNKLTRIDTVVLQINKRIGDDDALIVIHYDKNEKLTLGDAWIEDSQGNVVRKLKKRDIEEYSAISSFSLYEDEFFKKFELKHNSYPYKVIYSFKTVTSNFFSIVSEQVNPASQRRVRNMKIVVDVPLNYPIRYQQKYIEAPTIDTIGNNRQLVWQYQWQTVRRQKNAPLSSLNLPQLIVVPQNFTYGKDGSWDSWQSFGDWIYRLNDKQDELPNNEKLKINRLINNVTEPREKAKILYHYLQDYTRYVNVKIDVGGLKAYPASYVVENKYGDCKALCNYMKAMLTYVGIKSYYTLINAGNDVEDIDKSFPYQFFNHVIITIPFERDTVFLECTNKNLPFGYIGTFTQGREAFIIDGNNNSRFITTPSLTLNDVLCERKISMPVNLATIEVKLSMKQRGDDYELYNHLSSAYNKDIAEKYIRSHMTLGTFDLLNFKFDKQARDTATINFNATFKIKDAVKKNGNNLILYTFPREIDLYETPENRTQPIQIDYPIYYKDSIEYTFSNEVDLPIYSETDIKSQYGNYLVELIYKDNVLRVTKTISINKGRYSLSEYADFYQFISKVRNNERKGIYINH